MRKSKKKAAAADTSPLPKSTGPYRNIEEAKKHQVSSFPDIKKIPLKAEHDFIVCACDGIWDCFTNEEAAKFVRNRRSKGPKNGVLQSKLKKQGSVPTPVLGGSSPLKPTKAKSESSRKNKIKGDTSFIVEEMMDQGIAKGDITMSDGTGTDNMTCVLIQFRDPDDVAAENELGEKEEVKDKH